MKRYDIDSLYLVEIKTTDDTHYLICKYNSYTYTYREIFTNSLIKVKDKLSVKPLADYYPIIQSDICKKLSKKELLKKYIIINNEAALEKNEELSKGIDNTIKLYEILEKATIDFFPTTGKWHSDCLNRLDDLEMDNLPCHLRDDLWMARMLKKNQKIFYMSTNKVLEFVKNSSFFQEKRYEYEQKIVKWQIDWLKSGGANWIIDEYYGGDLILHTPVCDLAFRKGVVNTLSSIGIDLDAIEEGLEKNADSWRDNLMNFAFINEYEPLEDGMENLEPVDLEFKEKWLKMRKYEYYMQHKDSVDKYGVVEPDMNLTDEELLELKAYLEQKHSERKAQIEQCKEKALNKKFRY